MSRVSGWSSALEERWREILLSAALGVALALYYYPADLTMTAIGGALFFLLALLRLDLALLYVLFTAPLYRFPKQFDPGQLGFGARTEPLEFSAMEFTVLACFVAWVVLQLPLWWRTLSSAEQRLLFFGRWRLLLHPATAFFLVATLSLTASEFLRFSLREYRTVIVEPLLFYVMVVTTTKGWTSIWRWTSAFVLLGLVMALASLYHYFFIGVVEDTGGVRRILAIYHSPNALALFLGRLAPICLVLALFSSPRALGPYRRVYYALASALVLLTIVFTFSRGAWVGIGAALLFVTLWRGSRVWTAVAGAGAVMLAAVGLAVAGGLGRLVSGVTGQQRLYVWESAVNMIRDHPLQGIGLDNFLYLYRDRYMLPEAWAEPDISHPHNIVLDYWTRLGLLGLAVLAWLQVAFWRKTVSAHHALTGRPEQIIVLALAASMVDFLVHGLVDNSFFLIDLAVVFWLTFGLIEAIEEQNK